MSANNPIWKVHWPRIRALLTDVEVTGKYTGIIHLAKPSPSFWSATLTYTTGAISKGAAEAAGRLFRGDRLANPPLPV
ncbi:MAG: hypothetical protein R3D84_15830 [Paracoccaceae bacterium]